MSKRAATLRVTMRKHVQLPGYVSSQATLTWITFLTQVGITEVIADLVLIEHHCISLFGPSVVSKTYWRCVIDFIRLLSVIVCWMNASESILLCDLWCASHRERIFWWQAWLQAWMGWAKSERRWLIARWTWPKAEGLARTISGLQECEGICCGFGSSALCQRSCNSTHLLHPQRPSKSVIVTQLARRE